MKLSQILTLMFVEYGHNLCSFWPFYWEGTKESKTKESNLPNSRRPNSRRYQRVEVKVTVVTDSNRQCHLQSVEVLLPKSRSDGSVTYKQSKCYYQIGEVLYTNIQLSTTLQYWKIFSGQLSLWKFSWQFHSNLARYFSAMLPNTIKGLRELCNKHSLSVYGTKKVIKNRLIEYFETI